MGTLEGFFKPPLSQSYMYAYYSGVTPHDIVLSVVTPHLSLHLRWYLKELPSGHTESKVAESA